MPVKKTYSFTGDLKIYETCPRQYQFFRDLTWAREFLDVGRWGIGRIMKTAELLNEAEALPPRERRRFLAAVRTLKERGRRKSCREPSG
jgi:hypothetical protein